MRRIYASGLLLAAVAAGDGRAASLEPLSFGPVDVSEDASVIVGSRRVSAHRAIRQVNGVVFDLGKPPAQGSDASIVAVSDDGSIAAGNWGADAARWVGNVRSLLGIAGGSVAHAISGDGLVIVGQMGGAEPFRWEAGVTEVLEVLPGAQPLAASKAKGASADGSIIVGVSHSPNGFRPVRWVDGVIEELPTPPGTTYGEASAVTPDGYAIAGQAFPDPGGACLWIDGVLVPLPTTAGVWPVDVRAISADGSVAVGRAQVGSDTQVGYVWDAVNGVRTLEAALQQLGVDLTGWDLRVANSVTSDGRTLVGSGANADDATQGWIANLDPACSDGLDNDGDGATDHPADVGCASALARENPQCQDGVSNDGDGLIDRDGGASAGVPPESQTAPDPHCSSFVDNRELPNSCGLGFELAAVLPLLTWRRARSRASRSA